MIPGFIISWLTFPGVIVHEFAHDLFCRWRRVAVFEVCYFQFGNPSGYVIHEKPRSVWDSISISVGPFFVNSLLGALIAFPSAVTILTFGAGDGLDVLLMWLGVSIAMHSFPSTGDAQSMWRALWSSGAPASARLVGTPLAAVIYVGALGSVFWLDLIYGIGLIALLPRIVAGMMV